MSELAAPNFRFKVEVPDGCVTRVTTSRRGNMLRVEAIIDGKPFAYETDGEDRAAFDLYESISSALFIRIAGAGK